MFTQALCTAGPMFVLLGVPATGLGLSRRAGPLLALRQVMLGDQETVMLLHVTCDRSSLIVRL